MKISIFTVHVCTLQVSDDIMSSGDDDDWKAIGTSEKSRSPSLPKIDF